MEAFLILKGRTIDPDGLNIREEFNLRKIPQSLHIRHFFQCKLPLYLKKAGLSEI